MYYDDEARRFNFLSGLLLGSVLGTGLALLLPSSARGKLIPEARSLRSKRRRAWPDRLLGS